MVPAYDFSGQTAIVTGGARGIGRAVAERLRQSGARVWVWDLAPVALEGITSQRVDVTHRDQIATALEQVLVSTSVVDVLVNDAGRLGSHLPFEEIDPHEWEEVIAANLLGVLAVTRAVLPHLRRSRAGRIVNMGSLAAKEGLANLSVYSAASAGVVAFTKALAKEVAETHIRVNCVAPGPISTELIERLGPDVVASMVGKSPLKRLGTTEEVAELVAWLCSSACSFTTGAVFDISGGRAAY